MRESRLYSPDEEFTGRLRSRMPMNVLFTFSAEQLEALRTAFGSRFQNRHCVDVRGRVFLPWSRYYVVLQVGRDRRSDPGRTEGEHRLRTWTDSLTIGLLLSGSVAGMAWLATQFLS